MSTQPHLELASVSRRFGGLLAVRDVSFRIDRGEMLGLIGPNGSGQSTLLSLIAGQSRSYSDLDLSIDRKPTT